jgi:hypothetical protein
MPHVYRRRRQSASERMLRDGLRRPAWPLARLRRIVRLDPGEEVIPGVELKHYRAVTPASFNAQLAPPDLPRLHS